MCRRVKGGTVCSTAVVAVVVACIVRADESQPPAATEAKAAAPGNTPANTRNKRRVVAVRNGSAKDLAAVLQNHFQGEAEIQAAPEPANNTLLVAATPAVFDEVIATLAHLDRPSRKVIVEVWMIDAPSPREAGAGKEAGDRTVDERDFTGPIETVVSRLDALRKQKKVANIQEMRIETLENQSGQFQTGEEKPRVNGFTMNGATRVASPIVQQRTVGSIVQVTPRLVGEGKVLLELVFRNDHLETPEDALELAKGENGPIVIPDVVTLNLQSRVTVSAGHATLVGRMQTSAAQKQSQTQIVVAARIADETARSQKEGTSDLPAGK